MSSERSDRNVLGGYVDDATLAVRKALRVSRDFKKAGQWSLTESQREKLNALEVQLSELVLEIVPT